MQFKHPEILYALFALIIPILVHLFQLRKFKKVAFTNVAFLKSVTLQTRKSSQIKKWLTLLARLCALTALIIAFAQPFFASKDALVSERELVVYLDNSFSMEAKGPKGPLFKRAIQELLASLSGEEQLSVFTNDKVFRNTTLKNLKEELLQLEYSTTQLSYEAAYLKAKKLFSKSEASSKRVILVSDFQQHQGGLKIINEGESVLDLVQLKPVVEENIAIDSVYIQKDAANKLIAKVQLHNYGATKKETAVSLYDNTKLIAKTGVTLLEDAQEEASFVLPTNSTVKGEIRIEDPTIRYDNTRYFAVNAPDKIGVLIINEDDDRFLKNIFTKDEFVVESYALDDLDYNAITNSNLIVLNEVVDVPQALINTLNTFAAGGGMVCFIPASTGLVSSYRQLYQTFGSGSWGALEKQEKKVTTIHFSHPLYKGVFDNKVTNFQYPSIQEFYPITGANTLLSFEDNSPFLIQSGNLFAFAGALNIKNSNFKNAPLIVPTLYNMGKQSVQRTDLYCTIGQKTTYEVDATLESDEILSLVHKSERIIPQQQSMNNKVIITTKDAPKVAGVYAVVQKKDSIQLVAYNYGTKESRLIYHDVSTVAGASVSDELSTLLTSVKASQEIQSIWKWFVIFALLFLAIEVFLLKFVQ